MRTVGIPVLLMAWYVVSIATLVFFESARMVPTALMNSNATRVYLTPMGWYVEESDWPGSATCDDLLRSSHDAGRRMAGR
jgi:hypothetical protein